MRVIGGRFGGRKIPSPKSETIRPTSDFVRESIFNILNNLIDFEDIVVCDIFAGTGALGLESLSRGASYAYFIEKNRMNANNIKTLMSDFGVEKEEYSIICNDAKKAVGAKDNFNKTINLVFSDPPYAIKASNDILRLTIENMHLSDNAILVMEFGQNEALLIPKDWERLAQKKFGETQVEILRKL